jgi:hypothetical protein
MHTISKNYHLSEDYMNKILAKTKCGHQQNFYKGHELDNPSEILHKLKESNMNENYNCPYFTEYALEAKRIEKSKYLIDFWFFDKHITLFPYCKKIDYEYFKKSNNGNEWSRLSSCQHDELGRNKYSKLEIDHNTCLY